MSLNFHIHLSVRRIKSVKDLGICVIEKILILILLCIYTYIYILRMYIHTYIYITEDALLKLQQSAQLEEQYNNDGIRN